MHPETRVVSTHVRILGRRMHDADQSPETLLSGSRNHAGRRRLIRGYPPNRWCHGSNGIIEKSLATEHMADGRGCATRWYWELLHLAAARAAVPRGEVPRQAVAGAAVAGTHGGGRGARGCPTLSRLRKVAAPRQQHPLERLRARQRPYRLKRTQAIRTPCLGSCCTEVACADAVRRSGAGFDDGGVRRQARAADARAEAVRPLCLAGPER